MLNVSFQMDQRNSGGSTSRSDKLPPLVFRPVERRNLSLPRLATRCYRHQKHHDPRADDQQREEDLAEQAAAEPADIQQHLKKDGAEHEDQQADASRLAPLRTVFGSSLHSPAIAMPRPTAVGKISSQA